MTLRCVPAFTLHRVDTPRPREEVLDTFQERADANDHFELFTFPYADSALVLERNRTDGPPRPRGRAAAFLNDVVLENWALEAVSAAGKLFPRAIPRSRASPPGSPRAARATDRSDRIFANERRVRFTEMEYGVPREHGPEAVRRVIEWVRANRYPVFFPIEMRVVAADDALLSPSHERDTAYIAVHQYRGMEWRPYFEAVEEIMDDYGGRPHWGKRHFQTAATLAERYPRWADFQAARDELDPDRVFANEYADPRPRPLALEERLALAAVGRDHVDDLVAFDQVERVEALAELAGLGVAHVDAVADPQARRRRAEERRLHLAGALLGVELQPGGQPGRGEPRRVAAARGEVAAAERGRDAAAGLAHDRQGEAGGGGEREAAVVVEEGGRVEARAGGHLGHRLLGRGQLEAAGAAAVDDRSSANSRIAATTAARRSASSAAERRCMKRIAAPRRRRPGGRSPTPAIWPS